MIRPTRAIASVTLALILPLPVRGQAVRNLDGFRTFTLGPADDASAHALLGATWRFFGTSYSDVFVNNNGHVSFGGPSSTYVAGSLAAAGMPMIAPFFADVDTRGTDDLGTGTGLVTWGTDLVDGRHAFGVNWFSRCTERDGGTGCTGLLGVGPYLGRTDSLNVMQLVLIDRADRAPGAFDMEFNYNQVQWVAADSHTGHCARAGYTDGGASGYELPGSATCSAWLDSERRTGLIHNRLHSDVDGRYRLTAEGGAPGVVPEPSSVLLIGSGLAGVAVSMLKRRITGR